MAKKNKTIQVVSDGSEKFLVELVERFSVKRAIEWLRVKFPSFDTSRAEELSCDATKNEKEYFAAAELLGYVTKLNASVSDDANKPILVAAIKMRMDLTERTSRLVQFNYAKKLLQSAIAKGAQGVSGLPSQGLFFFYDKDGFFRLSLVTGEVEKRRFKYNEAKRQSFYIEPLAANNIVKRRLSPPIKTFAELKDVFSVEQLTKEFYTKLFDWYTWALTPKVNVHFPNDLDDDKDDRKYNNEAIIRMITRLMFTWFIRQRKLVPDVLFDREGLKDVLKNFDADSMEQDNYYRAILQNLFFATFNCQPEKRRFIHAFQGRSDERHVTTLYRHEREFRDSEGFKALMRKVPFLNCALFDCLDKIERPEDGGRQLYFDGFSGEKRQQAFVPNGLFFDDERGIINLFNLYEFTVNENNADDSDVALDPELLGKVFENLLGAFNPETQETARNATGSFYTPREIVDYMVEESLKAYLKTRLGEGGAGDVRRETRAVETGDARQEGTSRLTTHVSCADLNVKLDDLFDRNKAADGAETLFSLKEREQILQALYGCKILDPACGSGAFPMGILHCMVRLLTRLDPQCISIREQLLARYKADKATVDPTETAAERRERLEELESRLREGQHYPDYERKLYLIENCIYGVDIQPIATQIAKLRFFISLLCDQLRSSYDPDAENFGLLSLPNLEAKFVCANTLISLPDIEGELKLGDVKELRNELQANRHKIFRARSTVTKEKYKAKDLEIRDAIRETVRDTLSKPDELVIAKCREQIADAKERRKAVAEPDWYDEDIAVQDDFFSDFKTKRVRKDRNEPKRSKIDGEIEWAEKKIREELAKGEKSNVSAAEEYAKMVAGWDPYDQNASSRFFDAGWMLNIDTGFNVVIGNPPYGAALSDVDKRYCEENYLSAKTIAGKQKGSLDTFSLFVELAYNQVSANGVVNFILPMSVVSSGSMLGLHKLLLGNCREIRCSSYAVRPQPVFENAVVNTTILSFMRTGTKNQSLYTTKMYRKGLGFDLAKMIRGLEFVESSRFVLPGRIPKIGASSEASILEKLFKCKPLQSFVATRGGKVYYRTSGGRYFKVVTDYPTGSNKEKPIVVQKGMAKAIAACLSSNLGFWFYQIYSNNLDWKSAEILSFPIPDMTSREVAKLDSLYERYAADIERHANVREVSKTSKYTMDRFREYKIGYSKKIIDEIDDFIGPLYGLTKEEIEFIKNYEIEFRMADYLTPEALAKLREKKVKGEGEGGERGEGDADGGRGTTALPRRGTAEDDEELE